MSNKTLTKNFLEIRFKPKPSILDVRGQITEDLLDEVFNVWSIADNIIEFKSTDNEFLKGYFSFQNFGLALTHTKPHDYLIRLCKSFLSKSWRHFNSNDLVRIGIRTYLYTEIKNFKKARQALETRFFEQGSNDLKELDMKVNDIGFAFDSLHKGNILHADFGPMEKKQAKVKFGNQETGLFEKGLFLNVDYYKTNCNKIKNASDVTKFIKLGLEQSNVVNEQLIKWAK